MERIARFQQQVMQVRKAAISAEAYEASATHCFLAEIDRMMLEVRGAISGAAANTTAGSMAAA